MSLHSEETQHLITVPAEAPNHIQASFVFKNL